MKNNNLQKEAEETEFLTAGEQKISELVGSLERVSAPNNFEFRLKARIAARKDDNYQAGYWQWLRYLLPIGASAFILAFVLFGTNFFSPQPVEKAAEPKPAKSEETVSETIETSSNTIVAVSNSNIDFSANSSDRKELLPNITEKEPVLITKKPDLRKTKAQPKTTPDDDAIFTKDIGANPVDKEHYPVGTDPNKIVPKPPEFKVSGKIDLAEMLNVNGIETVSEGGKLKIKSIKKNSPAELAGVKNGDIVESFDEQKTNGNSNSSNVGGARKLTVSRDGKIMIFDLKLN